MTAPTMHSPDTRVEAHREQIRLLREAGTAKRFEAARSLTRIMIELARRRMRARMPDADDAEVARALARQLYGERLLRELGVDPPKRP